MFGVDPAHRQRQSMGSGEIHEHKHKAAGKSRGHIPRVHSFDQFHGFNVSVERAQNEARFGDQLNEALVARQPPAAHGGRGRLAAGTVRRGGGGWLSGAGGGRGGYPKRMHSNTYRHKHSSGIKSDRHASMQPAVASQKFKS